jgi:hypothetical protein
MIAHCIDGLQHFEILDLLHWIVQRKNVSWSLAASQFNDLCLLLNSQTNDNAKKKGIENPHLFTRPSISDMIMSNMGMQVRSSKLLVPRQTSTTFGNRALA